MIMIMMVKIIIKAITIRRRQWLGATLENVEEVFVLFANRDELFLRNTSGCMIIMIRMMVIIMIRMMMIIMMVIRRRKMMGVRILLVVVIMSMNMAMMKVYVFILYF